MAGTKISALPAATTLAGTEVVPVVQGGSSKKATITQLLAGVNLDAYAPLASPTFTGSVTIPTAASGSNTTIAASTAWVRTYVTGLGYTSNTGTVESVTGTAPIVSSGGTTPAISISAASTGAAGSMSASDKTKLDGVASGATANATDAQLRDRSTHTGTQAFSTLTAAPIEIGIACSDETTSLTTGTAKVTFRMPCAVTLTAVRLNVNTAPTGSALVVNIKEGGTTVFSTKPQIDVSAKTSVGSGTPAVISDSSLASDAEITIDIDQIGSTIAGKGLKVWLIGTRA
jgi:hypothetical protein